MFHRNAGVQTQLRARTFAVAVCLLTQACAGGPRGLDDVRPPRPEAASPAPIPDPPPSRVVLHATIFPEGIQAQLEKAVPKQGEGLVELIAQRGVRYTWTREPFAVRFERDRLVLSTRVAGSARFITQMDFEVLVSVGGEPVIAPDYVARLQSLAIEVKAEGPIDALARALETRLEQELSRALEAFRFDVRGLIATLHQRLRAPIPFPVSGGSACAQLEVTAIEAAPTVFASSMEKDLGVVVLPSVTLPCSKTSTRAVSPPLLANVAMLPPGPFEVVIPVAADYDELTRAMDAAIGRRLHFSKDYPDLYLESPEVFPSREALVLKLRLGGKVRIAGGNFPLGGELYFAGHPQVVDNQLVVPDLKLTPGSASGLLRLKLALDGEAIERQAQAAMRIDLSERFQAVRHKLSTELSFSDGLGCVRGEVLRLEVTGIHPHATFLRLYAKAHAQAALYVPCKKVF